MAIEQLREILKEKPGYFKKGKQWLADKFETTFEDVEKAFSEMKPEKTNYERTTPKRTSKLAHFKEIMMPKGRKKIKTEVLKSKPRIRTPKHHNVLVIGDLHSPFDLDAYLQHLVTQKERFNCDRVMYIGDLVDNHAVSYHEHDPNGKSPYDEYELAIRRLKRYYDTFPKADVCIGNHDMLPVRKVFTSGLPSFWLKSLEQILQAPDAYNFGLHHEIDGVFYTHGTGVSGDTGAMKIASQNRQSAVIGHLHTVSNIKYSASYKDIIFAMTVGCGIDYKQYAFGYGRDIVAKPIVSCGVVLEGEVPILIPMNL